MNLTKQKALIIALAIYLVSSVASFGAFRVLGSDGTISLNSPLPTSMDGSLAVDPEAPKTEACPINGQYFTKVERQAWEQRSPLLVMIENHEESRPQSGLSVADVVYEAIAEGGVTRFMGVFYCDAISNDSILAPIRSARTYFLDWASEYGENPLYVHVGGANCSQDAATGRCKTDIRAQALEQIQDYGWGGRTGNDINQFSVGYPTFWRDYERLGHTVATEHTMTSSTERLWELGAERGWTNETLDGDEWSDSFEPWSFKDDDGDTSNTTEIAFDFWEGHKQYDARWVYNSETKQYQRFTGGEPHLDHNTGEQLATRTVVVQFTNEIGPVDDLKHLLYETIDEGEALIFSNGKVTEARWEKDARTDRTVYTTKKGDEVEFYRGRIWIEVVDPSTNVSY